MSLVIDASIVFRLLANVRGDDLLRQRLARKLRTPALIDMEIASVVRGHVIISKPEVLTLTMSANRPWGLISPHGTPCRTRGAPRLRG